MSLLNLTNFGLAIQNWLRKIKNSISQFFLVCPLFLLSGEVVNWCLYPSSICVLDTNLTEECFTSSYVPDSCWCTSQRISFKSQSLGLARSLSTSITSPLHFFTSEPSIYFPLFSKTSNTNTYASIIVLKARAVFSDGQHVWMVRNC